MRNRKRHVKKIMCSLCAVMLLLTGCNPYPGEYVDYINVFGPNEVECNSYYHYMRVEGGRYDSCLARYDLITESDQEIYIVDDLEKQRIKSFCGDDMGVFYVVETFQEKNEERVLFYYDLNSQETETLLTSNIGYRDGNVYLLNKGNIIKRNLADGSETELCTLSYEGDNQLSFSWIGSSLVIFDEDDYQVIASVQT